jgi:hypothetical protein
LKIKNKRQMYDLLIAGRLGNTIQMWRSLNELFLSTYTGMVTVRSLTVSDPLRIYNDTIASVVRKLRQANGLRRTDLVFGAAPPDGQRILQGEFCRLPDGWHLRYNRLPLPMRTAFETENMHAHGLTALRLVQSSVCPADFDDMREVLDVYSGCIIEFSSYECGVGINTSRNTIIWEARNY